MGGERDPCKRAPPLSPIMKAYQEEADQWFRSGMRDKGARFRMVGLLMLERHRLADRDRG